MFPNKFDVGIACVLKVGIIKIIFKFLLISSFFCHNFLASFLLFTFFFDFTPFFSQ
jgi:hypothetical protein